MSLKNVFIVARIRNANENLCVKSNDPKAIARYIDDNRLYNVLLGTNPCEGLKMVIVGTNGKKEDAYMCLMIGAMVPVEHKIEYGDVVKRFDDTLCPNENGMFWSNNATYIVIDDIHHRSQVDWWTYTIKEMIHSYQIELWE